MITTQKPMTPDRANTLGGRYRWAALACLLAGLALTGISAPVWLAALALFGALHCFTESADHWGWRRGYLARKQEEKDSPEEFDRKLREALLRDARRGRGAA